ncbi:hypothetical protein ACFQ1S_45320, partial [Kibdelosporangium lantanae]
MTLELPATPSPVSRLLATVMVSSLRVLGGAVRPGPIPLWLVREAFDMTGRTPLPRGTKVRKAEIPGMWVTAKEAASSDGVLLYLHGGG